MIREAWEWVKAHAAWIGGGTVAAIAFYYLFLAPRKSSSGTPSVVSFPTQGGGSTSSDTGTTATTTTVPSVPAPVMPQLTSAQMSQWQGAYLGSTGSDPLSAFNSWYNDLAAVAPSVAGSLTQGQWTTIFNTINQSVAFNGASAWRDPTQALSLLNGLISQPSNVQSTSTIYYYNGSQVLQWLNGKVTDVSSQFIPTTTESSSSAQSSIPILNPSDMIAKAPTSNTPNTTFVPTTVAPQLWSR